MLTATPTVLNIPEGTIALTYDDGPGGHTMDIAKFLAEMEIPATFFLIGRLIERQPQVVQELIDLGHGVGNHTFSHLSMPSVVRDGGDIVSDVIAADHLIAKQIGAGPFVLRPPYGEWSPEVAEALNANPDTAKYIGPVKWDIDENDWQMGRWRRRWIWTLGRCRRAYLAEIKKRKKGTVLLHSCCGSIDESAKVKRINRRRLELTLWLIPKLKSEGFVFRLVSDLL